MTDNEINRLVAERVMGWSIYHYDKDIAANCYYILVDTELNPVAAFDGWHTGERKTEAEAWADAPAYCTDPAAWAGLLVWLKEQGNKPQLIYDGHDWWASLFARDGWARKGIDADSPGRALALAALRAYGVEVGI